MWLIEMLGGKSGLQVCASKSIRDSVARKLESILPIEQILDMSGAECSELIGKSGPVVSQFQRDPVKWLVDSNRKLSEVNDILLRLDVNPASAMPTDSELMVAMARDTSVLLQKYLGEKHRLTDLHVQEMIEMAKQVQVSADAELGTDVEWRLEYEKIRQEYLTSSTQQRDSEQVTQLTQLTVVWIAVHQLLPYQFALVFAYLASQSTKAAAESRGLSNSGRVRAKSPRLFLVSIGEVVLDLINEEEILTGAAANVATHSAALLGIEGRVAIASGVGRDEHGEKIHHRLCTRGIDTSCLQVDCSNPSAVVDVVLDENGNSTYRMGQNVAWDNLTFDDGWRKAAAGCHGITFSTLAQRSPQSREAIERFIQSAPQAIRIFDANLREKSYSNEIITSSLRLASSAKMNADELRVVADLLHLDSVDTAGERRTAERLIQMFKLDWLAITHGSKGMALYWGGQCFEADVPTYGVESSPGNSGAGDACTAALLVTAALNWSPERMVTFANNVGSYVASRAGTTPTLPHELVSSVANADPATLSSAFG